MCKVDDFRAYQAVLASQGVRKHVQLMLAPAPGSAGVGWRRGKLTGSLLPASETDFYAVYDDWGPKGPETRVLGLKPVLQPGYLQLGGPDIAFRFAAFNLRNELHETRQSTTKRRLARELKSPAAGIVGVELNDDGTSDLTLRVKEGTVLIARLPAEPVLAVATGTRVSPGQLLCRDTGCPHTLAGEFADGSPKWETRKPWRLNANKVYEQAIFLEASRRIDAAESHQGSYSPEPFPGVLVSVDLDRLAKRPPSPRLEKDLLAALGPHGLNRSGPSRSIRNPWNAFLEILADHPGQIAEVVEEGWQKAICYTDGHRQSVPRTAVLDVASCHLGAHVVPGQSLGDLVQRKNWTWSELVAHVGESLPLLVRQFLELWAVSPGESGYTGPGPLVDHRWVEDLSLLTNQGPAAFWWDLRDCPPDLTYQEDLGVRLFPVLPVDSRATEINFPTGVHVSLSVEGAAARARHRPRDKRVTT